jgi:hypothetical protein
MIKSSEHLVTVGKLYFYDCADMQFSPEFSEIPPGEKKNFRVLPKLSEIFSGEFFSGGNFLRETFRNFSK